jgi:hypothetical protein
MSLKHLKHEAHINNISKFSSYLKENATPLHYKDKLIQAVKENIRFGSENLTKPKNTLCGQKEEFLNFITGVTYVM